jgi:hypothetical protein
MDVGSYSWKSVTSYYGRVLRLTCRIEAVRLDAGIAVVADLSAHVPRSCIPTFLSHLFTVSVFALQQA